MNLFKKVRPEPVGPTAEHLFKTADVVGAVRVTWDWNHNLRFRPAVHAPKPRRWPAAWVDDDGYIQVRSRVSFIGD